MTELKKAVRRYSNGKIPLNRSKVVEMVNYIWSYSVRMDPSDISFNSTADPKVPEEEITADNINEEDIDEMVPCIVNDKPAILIIMKDGKRLTNALVDYLLFNHPFNMKEIVEVKDLFDVVEYERDFFQRLYSKGITKTPLQNINIGRRGEPNNITKLLRKNEKLSDEVRLFLELNGII